MCFLFYSCFFCMKLQKIGTCDVSKNAQKTNKSKKSMQKNVYYGIYKKKNPLKKQICVFCVGVNI